MRVKVAVEEAALVKESMQRILPCIHDKEGEPELSGRDAPPVEPPRCRDGILASEDKLGDGRL